jgi:hypothetical protein
MLSKGNNWMKIRNYSNKLSLRHPLKFKRKKRSLKKKRNQSNLQ